METLDNDIGNYYIKGDVGCCVSCKESREYCAKKKESTNNRLWEWARSSEEMKLEKNLNAKLSINGWRDGPRLLKEGNGGKVKYKTKSVKCKVKCKTQTSRSEKD